MPYIAFLITLMVCTFLQDKFVLNGQIQLQALITTRGNSIKRVEGGGGSKKVGKERK